MNKIWLIIKREYLTRVRKKSFLVITLLIPVFFAAMVIIPVLMAMNDGNNEKIAVVDESHLFKGKLADANGVLYKYQEHAAIDTFKANYEKLGYTGILYVPNIELERPGTIYYYSKGQPGIDLQSKLNSDVNRVIENLRMEKAGIDQEKLASVRSNVSVTSITDTGKQGNAVVAWAVGYGSGFAIYIVLLLFGMQVMRGVSEEKTSRIAEVMVSSVKPFELMMGKILGVAGVGLTQFIIWIVLITCFYTLALPALIGQAGAHQVVAGSAQTAAVSHMMENIHQGMDAVNVPLLVGCFLFYFVGGYLFYASLFAAVGSLVNEDANDAQSLTFPITLPVIIGLFIMFAAVKNPTSPLAVWGSLIPFTAPMVMMARLPYGVPGTVPYWQLLLSFVLLILGFLGTTWAAGKIYRTGILMYGKKITWGEAIKWVTRKQ
ncbi:ABC-2 type transport system permease protein [Chitinophaga costaii]|uniref:ABC-2 type transport system permease protein n=1 Tax=Chitinophaga costaii TaxID=1335309 RepID=A0A1C4BES2_9BACT|nr:ABC transporter permease [Chitinophaga costaii]PUZ27641.1 ABC transporter permease [Chitinophaga costaii]SCC05208.1 ABC-2 type transport system permease protein [Chitinophaga costaii]